MSWVTLLGIVFTGFHLGGPVVAEETTLLIDDRGSGDLRSSLGTTWRVITDRVMGGVSQGQVTTDEIAGRSCLRLQGAVRLENRGGFLQIALDLAPKGLLDASDYAGVVLDVYGNGEAYKIHLRTADVWLPWQSYRGDFEALPEWRTVRIPFTDFEPYRIRTELDTQRLQRIGLVAIGRAYTADLCLARLGLYRAD